MCLDHPTVQELVGSIEDRHVITYGETPQADVRLVDVSLEGGVSCFNVIIRDRKGRPDTHIDNIMMPMPGLHNALNATAALAVAFELGIELDAIRVALKHFAGVKRRFTHTGDWNGASIFDDYGHHPVEIAAVLRAARASTSAKVIAIVQPHRYTRLHSLFNEFASCFNDADTVIVADVYTAGEMPIEGADKDHLVAALKSFGHRQVFALPDAESLPTMVRGLAKPGDYIVLLGAGNITNWAYALPKQLAADDVC
jgi:UDP-N-acetylmuramate--alanine ligase